MYEVWQFYMNRCKNWPMFTPLYTCTHEQHTLTGRWTPRPSCNLTCANTGSHQVGACVTTVVSCLSNCCTCMINLAIGWISQSITVHSCQKEENICTHVCAFHRILKLPGCLEWKLLHDMQKHVVWPGECFPREFWLKTSQIGSVGTSVVPN